MLCFHGSSHGAPAQRPGSSHSTSSCTTGLQWMLCSPPTSAGARRHWSDTRSMRGFLKISAGVARFAGLGGLLAPPPPVLPLQRPRTKCRTAGPGRHPRKHSAAGIRRPRPRRRDALRRPRRRLPARPVSRDVGARQERRCDGRLRRAHAVDAGRGAISPALGPRAIRPAGGHCRTRSRRKGAWRRELEPRLGPPLRW